MHSHGSSENVAIGDNPAQRATFCDMLHSHANVLRDGRVEYYTWILLTIYIVDHSIAAAAAISGGYSIVTAWAHTLK